MTLHSSAKPLLLRLVAFLVCVMVGSSVAMGQLTRGTISGTVRDESGAAIAGAEVTITNNATNAAKTVSTDETGLYRVPALDPGVYTVSVTKDGFSKVDVSLVQVKTTQEVLLNVDMKIGSTGETVEVAADAATIALNKTNATIGSTLTTRQAVELPLSAGRDVTALALLSPNVFRAPGSSGISANGQRARNNNFTIDGSDNNDPSVTIVTTPIVPESVAEFQVQTNAFSVEFGRNSGAQINIITKSGTNEIHGQAFQYYRGSALNALDNQEKANRLERPNRFNRNQYGFDFGAPVVKDKIFFYSLFQFDKTRTGSQLGLPTTIPTQSGFAALGGVPLRTASGSTPAQSADSRQAALSRLGFLNQVYAANPTFTNIRNVMVNGTPIQVGTVQNAITLPEDSFAMLLRGDVKLSERDNFTVRYNFNDNDLPNAASNQRFGSLFSAGVKTLDYNLGVSETHTFSPTLLNEFRFSFVRRNLAFPENDPVSPTVTIGAGGDAFTFGGLANFPQGRISNTYQFSNTSSIQLGRHALKAGLDIRYLQLDNLAAFNTKGVFNFNNLQDYLNNVAVTTTQALQTASFDARQTQQFYFVQDDFRFRPNLTFTFGLRYETSSIPFGFFGATDTQSLNALVPSPVERDKNNFAPSVGFAYSPAFKEGFLGKVFGDGKSSIRGGFRVSYDVLFFNLLTVNASNFPRIVTVDRQQVVDGFPALDPAGSGVAPVFNPLATFVNTPSNAKSPYTTFQSLSVQRELFRDFIFEIGYTGSRALNQINQLQANPAVLTPAQAATVASTRNTLSIPNVQARRVAPQFGSRVLIASAAQSSYNAGFIKIDKRLSRGLSFGFAYTYSKFLSNNDESLGVGAITAASPQIPQDFFNLDAEKSVSAFDRPHRMVFNFIYEIPFFKGGFADNKVVKQIFTGWQISGIFERQSGQPFTILTGVDSNGNGGGGDRPNFVSSGVALVRDPLTGDLRTFTSDRATGQFRVPLGTNGLPLAFSLGNGSLGRNTLRAPRFINSNASLAKTFNVNERYKFGLRVDALNLFNQDFYGVPVNTLNSPSFGQNLNNFGNRSLTLSARFAF
jgi:outer membrane receptor protein involved in Fe transport